MWVYSPHIQVGCWMNFARIPFQKLLWGAQLWTNHWDDTRVTWGDEGPLQTRANMRSSFEMNSILHVTSKKCSDHFVSGRCPLRAGLLAAASFGWHSVTLFDNNQIFKASLSSLFQLEESDWPLQMKCEQRKTPHLVFVLRFHPWFSEARCNLPTRVWFKKDALGCHSH